MKQLYEYKFSRHCEKILVFHVLVEFNISNSIHFVDIAKVSYFFKKVFFCENTALKKKRFRSPTFLTLAKNQSYL